MGGEGVWRICEESISSLFCDRKMCCRMRAYMLEGRRASLLKLVSKWVRLGRCMVWSLPAPLCCERVDILLHDMLRVIREGGMHSNRKDLRLLSAPSATVPRPISTGH